MKRKFACGTVALCLALSVAGCGKNSEERQAANYYQNELGLDKDEAEELAHYLYGEEEEEEEPSVSEEAPQETVVEPLPELLDSEWYECKVQFYDMVFDNFMDTTEDDIRKSVEGSAFDVELTEDFDSDGEVCPRALKVDGELVAQFWKSYRSSTTLMSEITDFVKYGLLNEGDYYLIAYGHAYRGIWFDKASIEFEGLKTRDDVLAYLAENDFVEAQETVYAKGFKESYHKNIFPDETSYEYADVPHYLCKGAQSITLYRMHKLSETDQEIEGTYHHHYSGAHLNLVNCVTFEFNTDGTIVSEVESYDYYSSHFVSMRDKYIPGYYSLNNNTNLFMIAGEQID